jgi:hypothetical protein
VDVVFADSFELAREAHAILTRLVASPSACPEFSHLVEARILCVASQPTPIVRGAPCQAFICSPNVQVSPLKPLFTFLLAQLAAPLFEWQSPDFVLIVDAALWPTLDDEHRERLIYHELCHIVAKVDEETGLEKRSQDDGRILLKLVPHDYEFFDAEVRRYGPDVCDLDRAAVAIADGHRAAQRRRLHVA